jgi:hypothetical protein
VRFSRYSFENRDAADGIFAARFAAETGTFFEESAEILGLERITFLHARAEMRRKYPICVKL